MKNLLINEEKEAATEEAASPPKAETFAELEGEAKPQAAMKAAEEKKTDNNGEYPALKNNNINFHDERLSKVS